MSRARLNIGGKIELTSFSTKEILEQMRKLKEANKLKVKLKDVDLVKAYLMERYQKNEELKRIQNQKTKVQTFLELKNRFIWALSTPLTDDEKSFGPFGQLNVLPERKEAILNFLNFRTNGGFVEYSNFDKKGRGDFVVFNVLLLDTERKYCVLQGFQYLQWKSKEHSTSRNNYYLVGFTEENRVFTHPISGQLAWRLQEEWQKGKNWYEKFLKWAFDISNLDSSRLIMQGDVALYKLNINKRKGDFQTVDSVQIDSSHVLKGKNIQVDEKQNIVYIPETAYLVHLRNQHDTKIIEQGLFKICKMKEAELWRFSRRIRD